MKILIAPDSFKHSLTAKEVAEHLAKGILRIFPEAEIFQVPVADGGEGTVQSLVDATGGEIFNVNVHDPLKRKRESFFGMLGDGTTAVIEMAAASGIELLDDEELNPMEATSYGTGELMKNALEKGCRKMIIGIGGSATNDGGAGMAQALGVKFLDADGKELKPGGGALSQLKSIDVSGLDTRLNDCEVIVAADVSNTLTGEDGATRVYAPQKGASRDEVETLEKNLQHYAAIIRKHLKKDIEDVPGSGAAGGLGAGLMVFAGATIQKGFDVVKQTVDLEKKIRDVDLVITGEGKIDRQTQFGKTPYGVAALAKKYQKPVIAFAGMLGEKHKELYQHGFDVIFPITDKPMTLKEAITNAGSLLSDAAERMARMMKTGLQQDN